METQTLISIVVAVVLMGGISFFAITKVGRSGGTKITGGKGGTGSKNDLK
tara:strand:+ start:99 stop:248 length:150 start_codon:yes stop_codon:yes gene_type:complete